MCLANLICPRRHVQQVTVVWRDSIWMPPIAVQPPAPESAAKSLPHPPHLCHHGRHLFSKPMRKTLPSARRFRAGFTLVELLTVIAIIAILAAMLLPVLATAKTHTLKIKAGIQERDIVTAITAYNSDYGRFPVSPAVQNLANSAPAGQNADFTYGGVFGGNTVGTVLTSVGKAITNDEVMAILMDLTNYPGGGPTVNANYQKNPRQIAYLNAKTVDTTATMNGVGQDLVYRDPWGNPYVITMDLNYDELCNDQYYGTASVSQTGPSKTTGFNGLVNNIDANGAGNHFQYHGKVMVWSAGPDGKIAPPSGSRYGASWRCPYRVQQRQRYQLGPVSLL